MRRAAANERAPARGRRVVVLACGEPERGDDAVALHAVDAFRSGLIGVGGVDVRRCGALEPEHLLDLDPGEACVVVDCVAGIQPGEVIVRPLDALLDAPPGHGRGPDEGRATPGGRRSAAATPRSTHLLPVADVLGLVRAVRPGLPDGSFVGVGGIAFGLGRGLSPAVEAALPAFVAAIEAEVVRLASSVPGD